MSEHEMVVGTQYKVAGPNKVKDPSTERKGMIVQRSYANQIIQGAKEDPSTILRFEIDEEATKRWKKEQSGEIDKIPNIEELGYDASKKAKAKNEKPLTWNQVVTGLKSCETVESLRELFGQYPQFHETKKVREAFESQIEKLAENED